MIPILNTIIFLVMLSSNQNGYLLTLDTISIFTCIGMYILPVILSACLFDFIFKKKSVDFIGSMPITKKTIFSTNIIGGSIILFVMLLLTGLFMYISALFFPNVYLPIPMLMDYLLIFIIGYLFVYVTASLAFSLSGNMITGLVLFLLFIFWMPFMRNYMDRSLKPDMVTSYIACESEACKPTHFECEEEDLTCISHKMNDEYEFYLREKTNKNTYTLPYQIVSNLLGLEHIDNGMIHFDIRQFGLTIFWTIVYTIVGYYFFSKRKLEVSETSFGSFHTHLLVKCLTMFPLCIFVYQLLSNISLFLVIFILSLLLIYYFVYDLITRKKIEWIKQSLFAFILTICFIFSYCFFLDHIKVHEAEYKIQENEVDKITFDFHDSFMFNQVSITAQEDITYVLKLITEKNYDVEKTRSVDLTFYVGKDIYHTNLFFTEKDLDRLMQSFKENLALNETFSSSDIYYARIGDRLLNEKERKVLMKEVEKTLKDEIQIDQNQCELFPSIFVYQYQHHEMKRYIISPCMSEALKKKVIEVNHRYIMSILEDDPTSLYLHMSNENIPDLDYFEQYHSNDIYEFLIQHSSDQVDPNKEILRMKIQHYDPYESIDYYTNAVDAFYELIDRLREEVKNQKDYQEYLENTKGDTYE